MDNLPLIALKAIHLTWHNWFCTRPSILLEAFTLNCKNRLVLGHILSAPRFEYSASSDAVYTHNSGSEDDKFPNLFIFHQLSRFEICEKSSFFLYCLFFPYFSFKYLLWIAKMCDIFFPLERIGFILKDEISFLHHWDRLLCNVFDFEKCKISCE